MIIGWNLIDVDPKVHSGGLYFIQRWLAAVAQYDTVNRHVCYALPSLRESLERTTATERLTWRVVKPISQRRLRLQREWFFLRHGQDVQKEVDVLLSISAAPLVYRGPCISILLDCVYYRHPREFPLSRKPLRYVTMKKTRGSMGWITISQFVKDEACRFLDLDPARVRPVYIPANHDVPGNPERGTGEAVSANKQPYALYCTTISPRKNHVRLIQAFEQAFPNRELHLVIAGRPGWKCGAIMEYIRAAEARGSVTYLGSIDDSTRESLNRNSMFIVYPSVCEGFGMPVVEGFLHGKPVVTSGDSAMSEIAGDAALLCDPLDVSDMANALKRLATDDALRSTLGRAAERQLGLFSYEAVSQSLLAAISSLGGDNVTRHTS